MSHGETFGVVAAALNRCKQAPVQRKAANAIGHDVRVRVADEVARAAEDLEVRASPPRSDWQRASRPCPSRRCTGGTSDGVRGSSGPPPHRVAQRAQVGAIEPCGGLCSRRFTQPRQVAAIAASTPSRRRPSSASFGVRSSSPAASSSAYHARQRLEREPRRDPDPGVRRRQRDDLAEALGMAGREQQAGEAAPVVAGEVDALDPERVEQRDQVVGRTTSGSIGPGGASVQPKPRRSGTIRRRRPGQPLDHAAPLVPVLRPAVDEQQRLAGAGLGDVHAQPAHLDEAVLDPGDRREVVPHAAASIGP